MKKVAIGIVVVLVALVGFGACAVSRSYNALVPLEQGVRSQWAQVENVYQRRLDLIPNLVESVKGAAAFEKDTFTAVTEARAKVGQANAGGGGGAALATPEDLAKFQQAQSELGSALSRLLVVVEKYPDLKATQNFRDLQVQLEGTENRIAVERMRFNESAQAFNTRRSAFPTVVIARFLGERFREKPYFAAQPEAQTAPKVDFSDK